MLLEILNDFTCVQFPYFDNSIGSARCNPSTIWWNRNIFDCFSVFVKTKNSFWITGTSIPNFDFCIVTRCNDYVLLVFVNYISYLLSMTLKNLSLLWSQIPHIQWSSLSSRKQMLCPLVKANTAHIWSMSW
jgi:hypothetical protein